MKYFLSLTVGLVCGAAVFLLGFYFNPFAGRVTISPLAVTESTVSNLSYSVAVSDSIFFSNDGESISKPYPEDVAELWEPAIKETQLLVTSFVDARGMPGGIGIKISSPSEATRPMKSKILVNSIWHIYVPGRGTLAIDQTENYWKYLRDIVVPAWRNGSDSWRGTWNDNMTIGPGALGTARVTGMGGEFDGLQSEAVESLTARAYSLTEGPVAMVGTLSIALEQQSLAAQDLGE